MKQFLFRFTPIVISITKTWLLIQKIQRNCVRLRRKRQNKHRFLYNDGSFFVKTHSNGLFGSLFRQKPRYIIFLSVGNSSSGKEKNPSWLCRLHVCGETWIYLYVSLGDQHYFQFSNAYIETTLRSKWNGREREREREGELMTMAVCCAENELPLLFEHCFSILTLICESYQTLFCSGIIMYFNE